MKPGISNRESAVDEDRERRDHPRLDGGAPEPAGGPPDEAALAGESQTSHKAGVRSIARKTAEARHADRSAPASRKVAGAFGAEPGPPTERDNARSSHPGRQRRETAPTAENEEEGAAENPALEQTAAENPALEQTDEERDAMTQPVRPRAGRRGRRTTL
jgi:hypothetical protein